MVKLVLKSTHLYISSYSTIYYAYVSWVAGYLHVQGLKVWRVLMDVMVLVAELSVVLLIVLAIIILILICISIIAGTLILVAIIGAIVCVIL